LRYKLDLLRRDPRRVHIHAITIRLTCLYVLLAHRAVERHSIWLGEDHLWV